ncbi:dihydrofolate reductase family protein [Streptomyces doebereineriae]|uniref:Dihydrofolate reductase family protein n=1 Tax=Streptomyces doebereineriae TaxID=3075528 RepID=A0ABU2VF72_9ACTN|nr:dihydrofolate reductase family protein [Streptomyces sp. DSM 41640]MDT0484049.1 dihydrofolate reductase family protein [Streptomyces sp. DSM 41640]
MDPGNPVGQALNTRPKYVASATLTDPRWANTTVLSGDVAGAVGELRAAAGGELQVWGSGTLIRWLPDHRLVDETILLTYPVIVGQGTRLFPATGPDLGLELADLRSTPKGLCTAVRLYRIRRRQDTHVCTVATGIHIRRLRHSATAVPTKQPSLLPEQDRKRPTGPRFRPPIGSAPSPRDQQEPPRRRGRGKTASQTS